MSFVHEDGRTYEISRMFRVDLDGHELELSDVTDPSAPVSVAWIFAKGHAPEMTVGTRPEGAPLALVQRLVALARELAPSWRASWD